MFLDSDDWVEENAIEVGVQLAMEHNAQLVSWNNYYNYEKDINCDVPNKLMPTLLLIYDKKAISNHLIYDMVAPEFDQRLYDTNLGEVRAVWGKLFRTEIIKNNVILFEEDLKIGEDACFNLDVLQYVEKAVFANQYLNHYRIYETSANHGVRDDIVSLRLKLLKQYQKRFDSTYYSRSDSTTDGCTNDEFNNRFSADDKSFALCYTRDVLSCVYNSLMKYYCVHIKDILRMKRELKKLLSNEYVICIQDIGYDLDFFTRSERVLLRMIRKQNVLRLLLVGKIFRFVKK